MKYEAPEIKFVEFEANEVIAASTSVPSEPEIVPGDEI